MALSFFGRFLRWGGMALCLGQVPLPAIWMERGPADVGPAGLSLSVTNRQVILRYQSGEASARTVAFWIRRDAPFGEMADLTNAQLIDRVRTAAGSTTFIPDDNGQYFAAAMIYVSAQEGKQAYYLIPAPEEAVVDWVPPRLPIFPMLPTPILVTNPTPVSTGTASSGALASNGVTSSVSNTNGGATNQGSSSNLSWATPTGSNAVPSPPPVSTQVVVQFPSNAFYPPWLQALNPSAQGDKLNLPVKEFLSALTNLLTERQKQESPRPIREQYFSQLPDPGDVSELAAASRELRDLWGDLLRHRRDALPTGETDIYPLLLRYGNATVLLEGAYVRIMEKGLSLGEVERLRSDFAAVQRELISLWKRVETRLKDNITSP